MIQKKIGTRGVEVAQSHRKINDVRDMSSIPLKKLIKN